MRKFSVLWVLLTFSLASPVWAQERESFFDKYLPIAQLFDSPVFFASVVGSAAFLLLVAFAFILYTRSLEKKVYEWGKARKMSELLELLESPLPAEARSAFMYLRKHGGDGLEEHIVKRLQDQRRNGEVNPYYIYLAEDVMGFSAIPALKMISKSNSRYAESAGQTLSHLLALEPGSSDSKDEKKAESK
ncbi:MAG: hypothetical protein GC154_17080 [bacterium]|nr:hypothetical protein [bacterium]